MTSPAARALVRDVFGGRNVLVEELKLWQTVDEMAKMRGARSRIGALLRSAYQDGHSLRDIAAEYSLSRGRIRQQLDEGLRLLRYPAASARFLRAEPGAQARLRTALAAEPTPGPWQAVVEDGVNTVKASEALAVVIFRSADAAYIAAADPSTIRALLAERDQLWSALDSVRTALNELRTSGNSA
jgi:hypothetical protein